VRQNHQLLRVQNYSAPIVKSGHYFSDLSLPPVYWRKRNIARRFYSSMPFSEKRDLHLFVRFIHETFSRAHRTDLHLFIRMFTAAFQPIFHLTLSLSFPLFLSIFFTLAPASPLQKRELYRLSNETPDRYRSISCDNSFFYHSGTTAVARVKRSRQHIHATWKLFIYLFFFQRYIRPSLLSWNVHSLLMNLSSPQCRKCHHVHMHHIKSTCYLSLRSDASLFSLIN